MLNQTRLLVAAIVGLGFAASSHAAIITQWNFNSGADAATATGTLSPVIGAGTIGTTGGVTTPGFSSGAGSSDPEATDNSGFQTTTYPASGTANKTAGIEFSVSTVGYQDIVVSFDQRHSNTSANTIRLQYSTDGVSFVDATQFTFTPAATGTGDTWYNARTGDLSAIAGLDNNANAKFRIVTEFDPGTGNYLAARSTSSYGTASTLRFDMVTVNGSAIPEPVSLSLLAGIGAIALRRRAK